MSVDIATSGVFKEYADSPEKKTLLEHRLELHEQLGQLSLKLTEATQDYNACIAEIITTNEELRSQGVDTNVLGRQLMADSNSSYFS